MRPQNSWNHCDKVVKGEWGCRVAFRVERNAMLGVTGDFRNQEQATDARIFGAVRLPEHGDAAWATHSDRRGGK